MKIQTFAPHELLPADIILPEQVHGIRTVHVGTGAEDLTACDVIWTENRNLILGIRTADCAPVCVWDESRFGIVHAGWRGLVDGILEHMLEHFSPSCHVWVGPLYPRFEIQKDECYDRILARFGDEFFKDPETSSGNQEEKLELDFRGAVSSVLPTQTEFDPRSTYDTPALASWRRDGNDLRNEQRLVG